MKTLTVPLSSVHRSVTATNAHAALESWRLDTKKHPVTEDDMPNVISVKGLGTFTRPIIHRWNLWADGTRRRVATAEYVSNTGEYALAVDLF